MMQNFTVKVPGKLLLAGEYAILEPGSLALVLAVNRYLSVKLSPSASYSLQSGLISEPWDYTPADFLEGKMADTPPILHFAIAALNLGWQFLAHQLQALPPFTLEISSELHDESGHAKLGLGSSAAVCVAVLAALLTACDHDLANPETRLLLFKLALLAHRPVQGSGSGADIAGCIQGSVTVYTSPDFERIPWRMPLGKLLAQDWPLLSLDHLAWPQDWEPLRFGWTGNPAQTSELILDFQDWKKAQPEAYGEFLFESSLACLGLRAALQQPGPAGFVQGLSRVRRLLQRLDEDLHANLIDPPRLETQALAQLADAAAALGGAGKLSGAGGGDCGLAWVPAEQSAKLEQAWQQAGIEPLNLSLDTRGVFCEKG